jgi:hypothetical protein
LGSWTGGSTGGLCAGAGGLYWRRGWWLRGQCGMVPARPARSLCSLVPRQPGVREPGQRQQYDRQQHHDYERLQHDHHQQNHEHHECDVCESKCTRSGNGGSATRFCKCAACGQSRGCRKRTGYRCLTHEFKSCCGSDTRKRAGSRGCDREPRSRAAGSNIEPAGDREGDTATTAGTVCQTAAGSCSASRTAVGTERSADLASGERVCYATDGEAGASGQARDTEHWTSREPAEPTREPTKCRQTRPTRKSATCNPADESPRQSACSECAGGSDQTCSGEPSIIGAAEPAGADTAKSV